MANFDDKFYVMMRHPDMLKRSVEATRQAGTKRPTMRPSRQVDERLSDRMAVALPLVYTLSTPEGRLEGRGKTTNISGGGIQFLLSRPVAPHTPCRLRLTLPNQPTPLSLTAVVIWSRPAPPARFHRVPGRAGRGGSSRARPGARSRYEIGASLQRSGLADEAALAPYCQFIASQLLIRYAR